MHHVCSSERKEDAKGDFDFLCFFLSSSFFLITRRQHRDEAIVTSRMGGTGTGDKRKAPYNKQYLRREKKQDVALWKKKTARHGAARYGTDRETRHVQGVRENRFPVSLFSWQKKKWYNGTGTHPSHSIQSNPM